MTGIMTEKGQVKFKKRFNTSRRITAMANLNQKIKSLDTAIFDNDKDEIKYIVGLMKSSLDMILRCNN